MKKTVVISVLLMMFISFSYSSDINFYGGLKGFFNSVNIKYKDTSIENNLKFSSLSFGGMAEIDETYYFSLYIGLTSTKFGDPIVFNKLPFSIKMPADSKSGMFVNLGFQIFPFEIKGVEFGGGLNINAFFLKKTEWDINLPIVSGTFDSTINSYNFDFNLLARGEILNGIQLFGGPSFLKILGNINGNEIINEDLKGEQNINFSNKTLIGIIAGVNYNVEDYIMISAKVRLINSYDIMISFNYIF